MATPVATRDGGRASIDDAVIDQFRTTIRGELLRPGDPGYADRPIYNAMHRHRPALIVRCPSGTVTLRPSFRARASSPIIQLLIPFGDAPAETASSKKSATARDCVTCAASYSGSA